MSDFTFERINEKDLKEVYVCFMKAFADYAMTPSAVEVDNFIKRAHKNGYDPELSVAVRDAGRMIGFSLTGSGQWKGDSAAFDIVTGIVKEYRGKGLAGKMFGEMKEALEKKEIKRFLLEALQVNEPAIKAYMKSGFEITRSFDCFVLRVEDYPGDIDFIYNGPIAECSIEEVVGCESYLDWNPSWENSFDSLKRIVDDVVCLKAGDGEAEGILAYYPTMNWIMTLAVHPDHRREGVATSLLHKLVTGGYAKKETVRLVNVESSDQAMISCLAKNGFTELIQQYEMEKVFD